MKKCFSLFALMMAFFITDAQTIEQVYHYCSPTVQTMNGFQQINLEGCTPKGQVGEPTMPWQQVSLMLPQGMDAGDIIVEYLDFVELEGEYDIFPAQRPRTYSEDKVIPFEKNESLYRSSEIYPSVADSKASTQYLNGVGFAFSGFTPMRYVPATGKVSYAQTVKVSVDVKASRADNSRKLWLTPENETSIKRLAQNPEMLNSYDKRGREVSGYDMLLITREDWVAPLSEYVTFHNDRGVRTRVATIEDISNAMEGRDIQEQMRNYIIQEYENNGIMMVSLGGDVSIVPYRSLYCFAQEGYEDQLPSDMYFASLDGTLNDDDDDRWGEVGEDDLLPELGIGRLCFNNQSQLDVILHKTFTYMLEPVLGEFTSPILGAEHLGDGYYGSDDMERLIGTNTDYDYTTVGYPTDYNFKKYYATPSMNWNAADFRNVITSGGQYVHHVGHANSDYVAGWTGSVMPDNYFAGNNGIDHNYQLFHSHGCICGNFPSSCILEKMVTIPTGFVATTGNSRYGWYVPWGDGMAAHIHREFVDAYCNDHIQFISMALREAKIATAPFVTMYGEEGCLRWNIYCLNEMGDAGLCPWFEEPFIPDVTYSNGLLVGTTSTIVNVKQNGQPLNNFRVSLYHGEELLAHGLTDGEGNATLSFGSPLDVIGDMQLVITGQSAWTQVLDVTGFENGIPYVYADANDLEQMPQFGETYSLGITLQNVGDADAAEVTATLSTECEYINITNSSYQQTGVQALSSTEIDNVFQFSVADNAVDYTRVIFDITCDDGAHTHVTHKAFRIFAPELHFGDISIDDSNGNGNGIIDAGEEITLHINCKNEGHATAPTPLLNAICNDNQIHLLQSQAQADDINPGDEFTLEVVFTSELDIIGGSVFPLHLSLSYGHYETNMEYPISVGYAIETFESGDFDFMHWDVSGEQPWFITDEEAYEGLYSARSGVIGDNEISSLLLYMENRYDGTFSFFYKTSTAVHDYLVFLVDDKILLYKDKDHEWTQYSTELKAGSHVIEFRYDKSPNGVGGADCVWIDNVIFPPTTIVTNVEEIVTTQHCDIYPNPNNGSFVVSLESENANISVYNQFGQLVKVVTHAERYQEINLGNAASGLYYIRIQSDGRTETQKIIIQ